MARPRKVPLEGDARIDAIASGDIKPANRREAAQADDRVLARNVASHHAEALSAAAAAFKEAYPVDWEALRLCPLQHGLETMIEKLSA